MTLTNIGGGTDQHGFTELVVKLAIKYLAGNRWQGTNAERVALQSTTLSETEWVIRCKFDIITASSGGVGQLYFGFTDQPNSTSIIGSRDGLGIVLRTNGNINLGYATDQAWQVDAFAVAPSVVTYYIEFKRTSATNFTVTIYNNSGFSGLVEAESHTITSSISGLKYMSIGGWDNGASGEMKARISEVQIWNDTTSTSGTPVDFDLSTSSGWTFTGSACSISTGSEYLEGSSITNNDRGAKELPNVLTLNEPLGLIFEEYDTGDHFIWSGSAWNEMT